MKNFNPLSFLASVGAGGLAVAPFVFFQYTIPHGKGLITLSQVMDAASNSGTKTGYMLLMAIMVIFGTLHIALTVSLVGKLIRFKKTPEYQEYIGNPQKNTTILALFTSLGMTFNVFIGVVRFFVPFLQQNFQGLMLPALDRYKAHGRARHRLADGFRIIGIILVPLDIGAHIGRRHHADGVAEPGQTPGTSDGRSDRLRSPPGTAAAPQRRPIPSSGSAACERPQCLHHLCRGPETRTWQCRGRSC